MLQVTFIIMDKQVRVIPLAMTAVPGDQLALENEYLVGDGVYVCEFDGTIRASLLGNVVIEEKFHDGKKSAAINVISPFVTAKQRVISVGDKVICRVTKTNANQAFVDILSVGDIDLDTVAKAVIHREDIRLKEIDKVVVQEYFKPSNLVRAVVISLGDNKHYFLSTARDDLGAFDK